MSPGGGTVAPGKTSGLSQITNVIPRGKRSRRLGGFSARRDGMSGLSFSKKRSSKINHYENEKIAQEHLKKRQAEAESLLKKLSHGLVSRVSSKMLVTHL